MKLTPNQLRALRMISEQAAHDTEETPIQVLQELIDMGAARVTDRYTDTWGGKRHNCRMVGITEVGRKALGEAHP